MNVFKKFNYEEYRYYVCRWETKELQTMLIQHNFWLFWSINQMYEYYMHADFKFKSSDMCATNVQMRESYIMDNTQTFLDTRRQKSIMEAH